MRPRLLDSDQDLALNRRLPQHTEAVVADLGLESLFQAMAAGDELVYQVARHVVLDSATDQRTITYRQAILNDCLLHPDAVQELYELAGDTLAAERQNVYLHLFTKRPASILQRGVATLESTFASLQRLRAIADRETGTFASEGLRHFVEMIRSELDDDYLALLKDQLEVLRLRHGYVVGARLGLGNRGVDYTLRRPPSRGPGLRDLLPLPDRDAYTFEVSPRDESGASALRDLEDRSLNVVADALGRSTDHVLGFFELLRQELAFFVGCLNLRQRLLEREVDACYPEAMAEPARLRARGLRDLVLVLEGEAGVVPNDIDADGRPLVVITGANQGGKSTFLRSLGTAQLLLQAGMFVPAQEFHASLATAVLTHYKREEDDALESGKFDEELKRMSAIVDTARPGALILSNESFAATNEREGSEIARQIVEALLDSGVRVILVTHLFELASTLERERGDGARFLRAQRTADGSRTHHLIESGPLPTSFGEDLYRRIFGEAPPAPVEEG